MLIHTFFFFFSDPAEGAYFIQQSCQLNILSFKIWVKENIAQPQAESPNYMKQVTNY